MFCVRGAAKVASSSLPPHTANNELIRLVSKLSQAVVQRLLSKGRRLNTSMLWGRRLDIDGPGRVVVRIGRKQGNAVARNRFRRRVQESMRQHGMLVDGTIYLVGLRRQYRLDQLTKSELRDQLAQLLQRRRSMS